MERERGRERGREGGRDRERKGGSNGVEDRKERASKSRRVRERGVCGEERRGREENEKASV